MTDKASWGIDGYVTCSCCGILIPDTPGDNMDHDRRGCDRGFGECAKCAKWGFDLVFQPIFAQVREALNETNRAKWDTLSDDARARIVQKMLDQGILSWKMGG